MDDGRGGLSGKIRAISTAFALLLALYFVMPYIFREPQDQVTAGSRVTDCDRLAAHPSDTQKLAPGIEQADVDIAAAKRACHAALADNPGDGRTLYQLGRGYFYNDEKEQGIAYFRQSAAAGYAQGQFVLGLILMQGNGTEPDTCAAGRLWIEAARQRHLYSKIYLGQNWLDGTLADCALDLTEQELDGMVAAAEALADTPQQKDDVAMLRANWDARRATAR
jgi:TPR repeat protein